MIGNHKSTFIIKWNKKDIHKKPLIGFLAFTIQDSVHSWWCLFIYTIVVTNLSHFILGGEFKFHTIKLYES